MQVNVNVFLVLIVALSKSRDKIDKSNYKRKRILLNQIKV